MNLNEQIIKRKSIRKFDMSGFDETTLESIKTTINSIRPLINGGGNAGFCIFTHDEFYAKTSGMFRIDAPYYIMFFGDGSDDTYKNIGFTGELAALELTRMGLGTCWLGGVKSDEELRGGKYAVCIAFGKPLQAFRESADEAKRNDLDMLAIGYNDHQRELLEYARLAPSAMNLQPWRFKCEGSKIHVFRKTVSGLYRISKHLKTIQKIDIGIVLAHFTIKPFIYKNLEIESSDMIYEGTLCFDGQK